MPPPISLRSPVPTLRKAFGFGLPIGSIAFALLTGAKLAAFAKIATLSLLVGLPIALGTHGALIDTAQGIVITWWGVGVPIGRTRSPLVTPSRVELTREVRISRQVTRTVFPVRIVPSSSGSPPLEVLAPELLLPTRKLAEQLARSLRVPLHDSSSGALVVRSADLLGAPLRDRLRREPPTAQRHSDVAPGRLSVRRAGADTVCKLPPAGVQVRQATMAAALVVGTGVTALTDTVGNRSLASFLIVMLGVAVWFPLSVWLLRAAFARDVVRFGRDGIHLRRWGLPWSTHIPAGELEELIVVEHERRPTLSEPKGYLVAGAHLTARSDKRTLDLGDHLSSAEVQWLHASICDAIAEPTPG